MSPRKTTRKNRATNGGRNNVLRTTLPGVALVVASVLPATLNPSSKPAGVAKTSTSAKAKRFTIPLDNLQEWANSVVVSIEGVHIEGHSKVHALDSDCELHFGAHSFNFQGNPNGIVLEPMNVCVQAFPGKEEPDKADWINFANEINNTVVTVTGVPRIWPEHLVGGNEPSNPNHAVEIHPLTTVVAAGQTFDFGPNIFAGEYEGGVGEETADKIVQNTTVTVTRSGDSAAISFQAGQIGNFTLLDIVIDRDSIMGDGSGSCRMNGEIVVDDATSVPVHLVTAKGSPINTEIQKLKGKHEKQVTMTALVLFSLSPKALLEAAEKSHGDSVEVEVPLQLILYGPPEA